MEHLEAEKLYRSLVKHGFCKTADKIKIKADALSLDAHRREKWMQVAMGEMVADLDVEAIRMVRKDCDCALTRETRITGYDGIFDRTEARKKNYRKLFLKSQSLQEFAAAINKLENAIEQPSIEFKDGKLYKYFYTCTCPFLKGISKATEAWCYCTLGNCEHTFSYAFGREVRCTLIESIKLGGSRCAIMIE